MAFKKFLPCGGKIINLDFFLVKELFQFTAKKLAKEEVICHIVQDNFHH